MKYFWKCSALVFSGVLLFSALACPSAQAADSEIDCIPVDIGYDAEEGKDDISLVLLPNHFLQKTAPYLKL